MKQQAPTGKQGEGTMVVKLPLHNFGKDEFRQQCHLMLSLEETLDEKHYFAWSKYPFTHCLLNMHGILEGWVGGRETQEGGDIRTYTTDPYNHKCDAAV